MRLSRGAYACNVNASLEFTTKCIRGADHGVLQHRRREEEGVPGAAAARRLLQVEVAEIGVAKLKVATNSWWSSMSISNTHEITTHAHTLKYP